MRPLEAAICAKIAYYDKSRAKVAAARLGFSHQVISNKMITCWVGEKADKTVVAIRGSIFSNRGHRNYEHNLKTDLVPWIGQGQVHEGYHRAFWHIFKDLKDRVHEGREIYFTGHSMGGAIAILAGNLLDAQHIYCFASPRVGNVEFRDGLREATRITRFENRCDLLTKYPLSGVVKGLQHIEKHRYVHVGRRVKLSSFGHSMDSYLRGIRDKMKGA